MIMRHSNVHFTLHLQYNCSITHTHIHILHTYIYFFSPARWRWENIFQLINSSTSLSLSLSLVQESDFNCHLFSLCSIDGNLTWGREREIALTIDSSWAHQQYNSDNSFVFCTSCTRVISIGQLVTPWVNHYTLWAFNSSRATLLHTYTHQESVCTFTWFICKNYSIHKVSLIGPVNEQNVIFSLTDDESLESH